MTRFDHAPLYPIPAAWLLGLLLVWAGRRLGGVR